MGDTLAGGDWSDWSLSCSRLSMVKADLLLAPESGSVLTGDCGNTENDDDGDVGNTDDDGVKGGDNGARGTLVTGSEKGGLGGR